MRLPFGTIGLLCLAQAIASSPTEHNYRFGSLAKDEPQAVYSDVAGDAWNRIFHELFTRSIAVRLSQDFPESAPTDAVQAMGFAELAVSRRTFERIESGDRAIDPLYPSFFSIVGASSVVAEPRYSRLKIALVDAIDSKVRRPPLARALMQSDVWAAYDLLSRINDGEEKRLLARKDELLTLFARFIKSLALTRTEIEALPDNYSASRITHQLPDLFSPKSEWVEFQTEFDRLHDTDAHYRRSTRVFLKPSSPTPDKSRFLRGLNRVGDVSARLDAVALVVQDLLVDSDGKPAPTRLTYEVQIRRFTRYGSGKPVKTEISVFELSRKRMLSNPNSGGLIAMDERSPAYLPSAGNDYSFASPQSNRDSPHAPVLVPLRMRCVSCHGENVTAIFSVSTHDPAPPPIVLLNPADNDHARRVARRKAEREDFKALEQRWQR